MTETERRCSSCGIVKPLNEFYRNRREALGREYSCKKCKDLSQAPYKENRLIRKAIKQRERIAEFQQFKRTLKCQICGESEPCCLDFHHRDKKEMQVGKAVRSFGWKKGRAEMQKCVVICSNCHRKLHAGVISLERSKTA